MRKILYGLCKEQVIKFNDDGLCTLFCEVEAILNNRPLVEMSDSVSDLEALTPNHLLLFRGSENAPIGMFSEKDSFVKRRWRQIQYVVDQFWKRWLSEYLLILQLRQKWLKPQRNIQKGDIVILVENTPMNTWCMGRVLSVVKDKRGLVRCARVGVEWGFWRSFHIHISTSADVEMCMWKLRQNPHSTPTRAHLTRPRLSLTTLKTRPIHQVFIGVFSTKITMSPF